MKTTIITVLVLLLLFSCSQKENYQQAKKTIIAGQVSGFENVSEHDFIEFIYEDILAGQIKLAEDIDNEGRFKFAVDLDYPSEFYLKYSGLLTFYVLPGDSLHIDIDADCWGAITQTYADEYKFYKVSGASEDMNRDLMNFKALFLDSVHNWPLNDSMIRSCFAEEYKVFLQKLTKEKFQILEAFNKKNKTCNQFREWAELNLKFGEWDDLMRYRWLHPMYRKINRNEFLDSIPQSYFDFIESWDSENKEYLISKNYISFLHEYAMYYNQKLPSDAFSHLDKDAPNALAENFKIRKKHIQNHKPGFISDVLLAKMYYQYLDAKYYDALKEVYSPDEISDKMLANKIQQKFDYEKALFENPQFAEGSVLNELETENEFLKTLVSKYSGKVIYIDFWAPWCSPCMGEMPHSEKIKKQFEGDDVVFVYLANQCEETAWKTTIAEKKIEGEHYLLSDRQYAKLSEIFGVTGIPHYALIDKNGNIIDKKAPRPSSGNELVQLIEKHLK